MPGLQRKISHKRLLLSLPITREDTLSALETLDAMLEEVGKAVAEA